VTDSCAGRGGRASIDDGFVQVDSSAGRGHSPRERVAGRCRSRDMAFARTNLRLATAGLVVALSACATDTASPPGPGPTSTAPTTSATQPSLTQAPTTEPPDPASAAATDLLRRYFVVIDQLRSKPSRPIRKLKSVAISTQLSAQQRLIESQRDGGLRQSGSTSIAMLTVQSVNLDNSDASVGKVPTVQIDVCYDVSAVDILDRKGESVVDPDRPDTGWVRYSVSNYRFETKPLDGWRVASGVDLEQPPCAAS
jgi:hypothetical protein